MTDSILKQAVEKDAIFLPEEVLHDANLTASSKLIFGFVFTISSEKGYSNITNKGLGTLFNLTPAYVSQRISELRKAGYIKTEIIYKKGSTGIAGRHIYPTLLEV